MKNGKIWVARKGVSIFTEPLSKDTIVIDPEKEAFLVGPYPDKNIMILPFDKYHSMMMELKRNCPNAQNWKITAVVFIAMFILLCVIHLHHRIFSKKLRYQ